MKKSVLFCLLVFGLCLGFKNASATDYYWTGLGVTNSNWSNKNNWTTSSGISSFPSSSSDNAFIGVKLSVINVFFGNLQPTLDLAVTCQNVTIGTDEAATLTMNKNLTVNGTLTVSANGKINISGSTLTVPNATINNSGSINASLSSTITMSGTGASFNNLTATSSLTVSASTVNLSGGIISLSNSGTVTTSANSTFNLSVTSTKIVNNANAKFISSATTFSLSAGNTIVNTGGTFTATGCTFTTSGVSSVEGLTNQNSSSPSVTGIMTLNGNTVVNLNGSGNNITNNGGILYAGQSGSACVINLTGSNSQNLISNTNSGVFYLGSTSIIYPTEIPYNSAALTNSKIINSTGSTFTLQSDANGSAAIGPIPANNSPGTGFMGVFNVERFLTGAGTSPFLNRGYRLLSSPVNQTGDVTTALSTFGLSYLNQSSTYNGITYYGAYTTGPGTSPANGFNKTNGVPTIYVYNESLTYSNTTFTGGNHVGINSINTATVSGVTPVSETLSDGTTKQIPIGNGFLMYFVGSTGPVGTMTARPDATTIYAPTDATMTTIGHINQGTFIVNLLFASPASVGKLSYTPGSPVNTTTHPFPGFNMVGNPYPSTIDLNKVLSDNTGQISAIYVLSEKDSPNQKYIAYTQFGGSTPPALNFNYAVSGEGFFVQASSSSKSLTFNEDQKLPTGQLPGSALVLALHKTSSQADLQPQSNALTGLYMKLEKDSVTYSYCGVFFRSDWSDKFAEYDAKDMNATSNDVVMSSLSSDSIRLAVNHMPDYTKSIKVKLYANASTNGTYNLKIEGIQNIDTLYDIYLVDNYKKDSLDIRRYGTYIFDLYKSDTASFGGNRFVLSIHPRPLPAYKLLSFTGQKVTSGVQLNWKTEAEGNYTGFVLQKADGATFNSLYTKQSDSSGTYTYIDPNPVTGNNTYRLQQSDIVGNLSYSSPVTIIYNQAGATGAFSVYPNPAAESISINVTTTTSNSTTPAYKLNIYNSAGQLMLQKSISSNTLTQDVTQYLPGTYVIQLTDNSGNLIGKSKFVKN